MSDKMSISILKQIKGFQVEIGLQCTKTWNKCKIMWTHSHMKWKCARIKEVIPRLSSWSHMVKVENFENFEYSYCDLGIKSFKNQLISNMVELLCQKKKLEVLTIWKIEQKCFKCFQLWISVSCT